MTKTETNPIEKSMEDLAMNYTHLTDEPIIVRVVTRACCGYVGVVRAIDGLPICPSCKMIAENE